MALPEERFTAPSLLDRLARLLTRETSSGHVIREIDGFRFIAIMAVVVFHLMHVYLINTNVLGDTPHGDSWSTVITKSNLVKVISVGFWGVQLFFVISGFVLALPFIDMCLYGGRRVRLSLYYLRRVVRIEPPFLVNLIVLFVILWAANPFYRWLVPHLLATMAYSHFLIYGTYSVISGVTWTLEVEAQFYLTMPLLAFVFRLRSAWIRRLVLVLAILLFGLLQVWMVLHPPSDPIRVRLERSLIYWLQYFLAGFLLADIYAAHLRGVRTRNLLWDAVGATTAIATFEIMLRHFRLWPLIPFLIALFYFSVFRGPILNWLLTLRWVVVIGGMCYSIYLYHEAVINHLGPPVMARIAKLPLMPGFAITFAVVVAAVLAIGGLTFVLIEKPFMHLSSRLAHSPDSLRRASDWIYAKLARVTSTGQFIAEVDGFRFAAILPVMLAQATYHFMSNRAGHALSDDYWTSIHSRTAHILSQGYVGVLMFFVISGFVIGLPFARAWLCGQEKPSLRFYFLRRFTRIEPPYILNMTFCLFAFGGWAYLGSRILPYLASITYLHNIVYAKFSSINIVAWSLEIEVQFYLLAPLLAYIFAVKSPLLRRFILLAGMAALGGLANLQLLPFGQPHLKYTLISYLQYFLAGLLLADLYATGVVIRRNSLLWDLIAIAAALGLLYGPGWRWESSYWSLSFLILLMWVGGFQGRIANWFFTRRLIVTLGGMCYTMCLWHNPLLILTGRWLAGVVPRELPFRVQVFLGDVISVVAIAAVCAVLFYFTERPFMGNHLPQWIAAKWRGYRIKDLAPATS